MGNRTAAWQHGALVGSWTSNAADQVLSWRYAAAGNLLRDNTASYRYDALGWLTRVTSGGTTTTATSNGNGVLVAAERGAGITPFTQDLAAPLSQVLHQTQGTTTTSVLSGHARLAAVQHGTRSWELHDGLGSVRLLLDEAGEVQHSLGYDYTDATRLFGESFLTKLAPKPATRERPELDRGYNTKETIVTVAGIDVRITDAGRYIVTMVDGKKSLSPATAATLKALGKPADVLRETKERLFAA